MKLEKEEIQKSVLDFYKDIAIGKEKVKKDVNDLAKSFGYSNEELKSIPKEANLGLGCGNPQEKSKAKESEVVVDLGCGKGMDAFLARKYCKRIKMLNLDLEKLNIYLLQIILQILL